MRRHARVVCVILRFQFQQVSFFHDDMFIDDNLARYVLLSTFDRSCICVLVFIGHASPMKPVPATCLVYSTGSSLARIRCGCAALGPLLMLARDPPKDLHRASF